jgi:hypothetical protein
MPNKKYFARETQYVLSVSCVNWVCRSRSRKAQLAHKTEKKTTKFHVLKLVIKDLDPESPKRLDLDSGECGYDILRETIPLMG